MPRKFPNRLAIVMLAASLCYGQSLADIARQNQNENQNKGSGANKVYTTDDLSPIGHPSAPAPKPDATKACHSQGYDKLGYASFTPEMWARAIKGQKDWIGYLQKEADKLKMPPTFDQKKAATDPEAKKFWEERGLQQQYASELPGEQKKLKDLQFEAQKAGMPASIWDPQ